MRAFMQKNYRELVFAVIIVLCLMLMASGILLLSAYVSNLEEQAQVRVEGYAADTEKMLAYGISQFEYRVSHVAERLSSCQNQMEITQVLSEVASLEDFSDLQAIRCFKDGVGYDRYGVKYAYRESQAVLNCVGKTQSASTGIVYDYERNLPVVGFYAPVKGNEKVDSVVMFFPLSRMIGLFDNVDTIRLSYAEFVSFCNQDGTVLGVLREDVSKELYNYENIFEFLHVRIHDKGTVDLLERKVEAGESGVIPMTIDGESYFLSIGGGGESAGGMCVIGLYHANIANESGYSVASTIIISLIVVFALLIMFAMYFMLSRKRAERRIYEASALHPQLKCYTLTGFCDAAETFRRQHRSTQYAVVALDIKFFDYIGEHYGADVSNDFLRYLNRACKEGLAEEECYGYDSGGRFLLLLHYREQQTLINRLRQLYLMARRFPKLREDNYLVKMVMGVYTPDAGSTEDTKSCVDKAILALETPSPQGREQMIKFFTSETQESYRQSADIESKADFALKNREFVVFYQPKMNLHSGTIDGCEALVRWYDPQKQVYRAPATFLPLFESNGFIGKVDIYVYQQVCEYITESIERNVPIYPISVNVSRVTASDDELLTQYIRLKQQYKIPDNFITLEFTESFAYENYDYLNAVVQRMKSKGFRCSVDDFGSGYSSYNLLKKVPMDELKMDRLFIADGISRDRDRSILANVIQTAKDLGMHVVQEGVETADDVQALRDLGCDCIQGYYYSKPLVTADYIAFIEREHQKEKKQSEK